MKYLALIALLITFATLHGQNDRAYEMQRKYYNDGLSNLNKADDHRAFLNFAWSLHMDSTGIFAMDAGKKRDSLRSLLRAKLVKEFQGVWKVITSNKVKSEEDRAWYDVPGRIIKITKDTISCYSSKKDLRTNNPKSSQAIKFIDIPDAWPTYNEIIHDDNQVWSYTLNMKKNRLEVLEAGEYIDNKNYSWIISHPSGNWYKRINWQLLTTQKIKLCLINLPEQRH